MLIVAAYDRDEEAAEVCAVIDGSLPPGNDSLGRSTIVGRDSTGNVQAAATDAGRRHAPAAGGGVLGLALGAIVGGPVLATGVAGAAIVSARARRRLRPLFDAIENTLPPGSAGGVGLTEPAGSEGFDHEFVGSRRVTKTRLDAGAVERLRKATSGA